MCSVDVEAHKAKADMNLPREYAELITMDNCGPHLVNTWEIRGA